MKPKVGAAPVELQTARLLLRSFRESDLAPFAMLNADPRVMEFFPAPLSRVESDLLAERIQEKMQEHGFGLWALEVPGVLPFAGFCGLSIPTFPAPFMPCVEIGWRLAFAAWGQGWATEAARAVLAFGHSELGLKEIVSFTSTTNVRSMRVMERIGMKRDPARDFLHPKVPSGHPLEPHVLYASSTAAERSGLTGTRAGS